MVRCVYIRVCSDFRLCVVICKTTFFFSLRVRIAYLASSSFLFDVSLPLPSRIAFYGLDVLMSRLVLLS